MSNRNILIVEDNHKERSLLSRSVEELGFHVTTAHDGTVAAEKIKSDPYRLVITSFEAPGVNGRELLETAQSGHDGPRLLFLSNQATVEDAVEMMKNGAFDFILKPVDFEQLKMTILRAFEGNGSPANGNRKNEKEIQIVTKDRSMLRILELAKQIADSKASVLIQGESGTGKELFARFVHYHSGRRNGPFVAVNCGALPESLLESEMFGHEKGAFTGAVAKKPGKFELAHQGTILLDEITEMAFHLQSKLLRVLQEQEVDRVGSLSPVSVDTRVIATTNQNIRETIEKGFFREDLFYRLNVIPIRIPSLRQRKDDIPMLAQHFIEKYNAIDGRNVKSLTRGALEKLLGFSFPGNVRELENIMERSVLLAEGDVISDTDLLLEESLQDVPETPEHTDAFTSDMLTGPLKEVEKKIIFRTLDQNNGNRTHAAKILGISVRTLRNKLNEYKENMGSL
ncbi:MAG TPA: sigma-54-dependent Fis family transcriptional regulator [Deltaproteobacteria bacterium]|nr:sigma-54-dependent Fis family transcriptional regulator [Deltaproteobacteria bacterium]